MSRLRQVRKRDGRLVPFRREKIADAIFRAAQSVGGEDRFLAEELAGVVTSQLELRKGGEAGRAPPTIEDVQDAVERILIEAGHARTAKAYILYRDRRAQARAARDEAREAVSGETPLIGGDEAAWASPASSPAGIAQGAVGQGTLHAGGATALGWSKAAIADALVARDGLDRSEAEDVARSVEARILSSRLPRIDADLLASLVRVEMFARGRVSRIGSGRRIGLRRDALRRALREGVSDRRANHPAALAEGLGEALVAQHVLEETLPPAVAEAQRSGDLHIYDLGAPLRLAAVALDAPSVMVRRLAGEAFSRASGPRRAAKTLEDVVLRYSAHAARLLALENVNVFLAPFFDHLDEDALSEEVRQLLLGPAVQSMSNRGGLLRLELGLCVEVPPRLRALPTSPPAPPGRHHGDYGDAARRVTQAILRELVSLRREGHEVPCAFTLVLPRHPDRDAALRAVVNQALATAAEVGEPVVVLDRPDAPSRGSRWFRLAEAEALDPLRFDRGDVTAASATAINVVAAALRTRRAGMADFLRELDRLIVLALDAAAARNAVLESVGDAPGAMLYELRRGPHPLVDLEGARHLVEMVGVDQAAALLDPRRAPAGDARAREDMRLRIVEHVERRVQNEAAARDLRATATAGLSEEAAVRLAGIDRERFEDAARWWAEGERPSYRPASGLGVRHEPFALDRGESAAWRLRLRHRVDGERRPPLDELVRSFETAVSDRRVCEYALEPWPRRHVHMPRGREA